MTTGPSNSFATGVIFTDYTPPSATMSPKVCVFAPGQSNQGFRWSEYYPALNAWNDFLGLAFSSSNIILAGQVGSSSSDMTVGYTMTGGAALFQNESNIADPSLYMYPFGTGATLATPSTWPLGQNGNAAITYISHQKANNLPAGSTFFIDWHWGESDGRNDATHAAAYLSAVQAVTTYFYATQANLTVADCPMLMSLPGNNSGVNYTTLTEMIANNETLTETASNNIHHALGNCYDNWDRGDGAHMSAGGNHSASARISQRGLRWAWEKGRTGTFNGSMLSGLGAWFSSAWLIDANTVGAGVTHDRGADITPPSNNGFAGTGIVPGAFAVYDPDASITYPISSITRISSTVLHFGINGPQQIAVQDGYSCTAYTTFTIPATMPTTGSVVIGPTGTSNDIGYDGKNPTLSIYVSIDSGVVICHCTKNDGTTTTLSTFINGNYVGHGFGDGKADGAITNGIAGGYTPYGTPGPNSTLTGCAKTGFYGPGSLPTDDYHLRAPAFPSATAAIVGKWINVGQPIQMTRAPIKLGTVASPTVVPVTLENTQLGKVWMADGNGGSAAVPTNVTASTNPIVTISTPAVQVQASAGATIQVPYTVSCTTNAQLYFATLEYDGVTVRTAWAKAPAPTGSGPYTTQISAAMAATNDFLQVSTSSTGSPVIGSSGLVTMTVAVSTAPRLVSISSPGPLTTPTAGKPVSASFTIVTANTTTPSYRVIGNTGTDETAVIAYTPDSTGSYTATIPITANGDAVYVYGDAAGTSEIGVSSQITVTVAAAAATPTLVSVTAPGSLTQSAAGVAVSVPTTFVTTGATQFYWSVFGQVTSGGSTSYPLRAGPNLLSTTGTATASVPYSYTGDFLKITTDSSASNAIGYGAAATLTVAASTTTTTTVASLPTTLTLTPFSNATGQDFTTTTAFNTAVWTNVYGTGFTWTGTADGLKITSSSTTSPAWQQSGFMQLYSGASGGFGYGLFTFRARTGQSIQGPGVNLVLWNADGSWLSSGNVGMTGKGTYSEVDILESINGTSSVQGTGFSTLHYYDSTQTGNNGQDNVVLVNSSAASINLNTMHDYALYWADGVMALYVDETLLWQRTGERVPKDYAHGGCNKTLGAQVVVPSGTTEVATSVVLNIASMYHYTGSLTTGTTATAGLPAIALPTYAFRPNFDAIGQNPQFEYYWKGENDVANQVGLAVLNDGGSDNYRNQTAWLRTTGNYAGPSTGFEYWSIAFRNFVRVTANPLNTSTVIVYADNTSYLAVAGEPLMFWAPTPTVSSTTTGGVTTYSVSDDNPAQALTAFPFTTTSVATAASGTTAEVLKVASVSVPWTTFPLKTELTIASSSTVNLDASMNEIASGATTTVVKANAEKYIVTLPTGVTCPTGFNWTYLTAAQYPSLTNPALYGRHNSFYSNSQTKTVRWQVQAMLTAALTVYLPRGASFTYGGLQGEPTYRDWGSEFVDFGDLARKIWSQEMQGIGAQLQTWHDPNKICIELENEPTSATWAIYNTNLAFMGPVARTAAGPYISLGIKGIGYGSLNQALTGFTTDLQPFNPCVIMAHAYVFQNTYSSFYPSLSNTAASAYDSNGRNSTNGQLISWADDMDGQYCADVFTILRARTGAVGAGFSELGISNYYYPTDTIRDRMLGRLVAAMAAANHFVMNWNGNSDTDITNGYADDGATAYGTYSAGTQLVLSRPVFRATASYATLAPTLEATYSTFTAPTLAVVPAFAVTATTVPTTIAAGASGTSTIAVGATATYAKTITLSVLAPTGITVSLSSTSAATGAANLAEIITATHTVASTVAAGTYAVIVTGTDGTTTRTTSVPLVVTASATVVVTPVSGLPITTLPTDLASSLTAISTLNTAVGSVETTLSTVETSVASLRTSVATLQASAITLQAALTALQTQATAVTTELSAIANLIRGPHA